MSFEDKSFIERESQTTEIAELAGAQVSVGFLESYEIEFLCLSPKGPETSLSGLEKPSKFYLDLSSGTVICREWSKDGLLGRSDGPSVVADIPGGPKIFQWFESGNLHRTGGPAHLEIARDQAGIERVQAEMWYRHGRLHRESCEVAVRVLVDQGRRLETEERWYDGQLHSSGRLPSRVIFADGPHEPLVKEWHKGGELHRNDGPARIELTQVDPDNPGRRTLIRTWYQSGKVGHPDFISEGSESRLDASARGQRSLQDFRPYYGEQKTNEPPSVVATDLETGALVRIAWYQGGVLASQHIYMGARASNVETMSSIAKSGSDIVTDGPEFS